MKDKILAFLNDENGPTAVEYAVMLACIVVVCIGSVKVLASRTGDSFDASAAELSSVMGP